MPFTGYLADRFGKKVVLLPSLVLFAICGGLISLAPNEEILIALRFLQGVGASALSTLNTALIPDLFSGRNRVKVIGYVGVTQGIGSGLLPLIGGLLASITWYLPFTTALIALPVGIYVLLYLDNAKPDLSQRSANYLSRAWQSLADRRVIELCFFTFGFIFVGFGYFVSYVPSFLNDSFGSGPTLIGIVITTRAITGAAVAGLLNRMTQLFSSPQRLWSRPFDPDPRYGLPSLYHQSLGGCILSTLLWCRLWYHSPPSASALI